MEALVPLYTSMPPPKPAVLVTNVQFLTTAPVTLLLYVNTPPPSEALLATKRQLQKKIF